MGPIFTSIILRYLWKNSLKISNCEELSYNARKTKQMTNSAELGNSNSRVSSELKTLLEAILKKANQQEESHYTIWAELEGLVKNQLFLDSRIDAS